MSNSKYKFDKDELNRFPEFFTNENLQFIVGDLFQAKQELIRYELGEIASINNLLAGSYLKMKSFHEEQIESSLYEESEFEQEKITKSSQSTQQMMSEVSRNTLNKSNSFTGGGGVSGTYGAISFSANFEANVNNSKQTSKESAKEITTQIVNQSEEKVRERRLRQAFSRNLEIIRKEEEYGFDNRGGGHVVGVKCFVNEVHKVTLLNHHKHLFSTIMVAHPSEWYKKYLSENNISANDKSTSKPVKDLLIPKDLIKGAITDSQYNSLTERTALKLEYITVDTWQKLAFHFGVSSEELTLPPFKEEKSVTGFITQTITENEMVNLEFKIPDGFKPKKLHYGLGVFGKPTASSDFIWPGGIEFMSGGSNGTSKTIDLDNDSNNNVFHPMFDGSKFTLAIKLAGSTRMQMSAAMTCEKNVSELQFQTWQLDFYNALKNAKESNAEDSPSAFFDNIGTGKVDFRNNPTLAKKFINHELQRCIVQQVFGTDLEGFSVLDRYANIDNPAYPEVDLNKLSKLSPILNYLNLVFDYEKMTYRFLPNYLGAKWNREELFEDTPIGPMKDFMEASFAQVILPVARGMEHRFRYFMVTNGLVFEGEDVPVIDDEVSLSVLDELEDDPSLLDDEAAVVSTSKVKLPSPHIILMKDADIGSLDYSKGGKLPEASEETIPTPNKGETNEPE